MPATLYAGLVLISRFWQDSIWPGFIFAISTGKYEKGIEFRDSLGVPNLNLVFNSLRFSKYLDKMKQAKRMLTLFHNRRHSYGMERTSRTSFCQYLSNILRTDRDVILQIFLVNTKFFKLVMYYIFYA